MTTPASTALDIDYACRCDYFVPNETELEILTGMPVGSDDEIAAGLTALREEWDELEEQAPEPAQRFIDRAMQRASGKETAAGAPPGP